MGISKITPPTDDELADLELPVTTEAINDIEIAPDPKGLDEFPEVEETEVTQENYPKFLPRDIEDLPPLDEDGKLTAEAQTDYDETPPQPQEGYETGQGA